MRHVSSARNELSRRCQRGINGNYWGDVIASQDGGTRQSCLRRHEVHRTVALAPRAPGFDLGGRCATCQARLQSRARWTMTWTGRAGDIAFPLVAGATISSRPHRGVPASRGRLDWPPGFVQATATTRRLGARRACVRLKRASFAALAPSRRGALSVHREHLPPLRARQAECSRGSCVATDTTRQLLSRMTSRVTHLVQRRTPHRETRGTVPS
jgi:hypothetical protein